MTCLSPTRCLILPNRSQLQKSSFEVLDLLMQCLFRPNVDCTWAKAEVGNASKDTWVALNLQNSWPWACNVPCMNPTHFREKRDDIQPETDLLLDSRLQVLRRELKLISLHFFDTGRKLQRFSAHKLENDWPDPHQFMLQIVEWSSFGSNDQTI